MKFKAYAKKKAKKMLCKYKELQQELNDERKFRIDKGKSLSTILSKGRGLERFFSL
ncbi:hypothetical protein DBT_2288 [Dissulfuribacter thermophilus]|uniref:Uncharacterized protein n=1 Tax=Dissulfuribacter thermophilus TaxID=1156395 RepID=A0A1B9F2Y6_9BACT|nr:hypothetical protein DBT_2288 [Dissulfuribacter thermophilus]